MARRLALALLALAATGASAAPPEPARFDRFAFERAVVGRVPVVIHFTAGWCRACQLQQPVIAQLLQEVALRPVKYFAADHDRERLLRSILGVPHPGTLIAFRNGAEVARSTAQTSRTELREIFLKAARDADPVEAARGPAAARAAGAASSQPSVTTQTPFTPFSIDPSGRRP